MKIKISVILVGFVVVFTSLVMAGPLTKDQSKKWAGQSQLREQMSRMIISIADLDILVNRDKVADYEIFTEDAQRILEAIKKMRALDKDKDFEPFFKQLETPTQELLKFSKLKNKKAMEYPQKIFNACFACHQKHRGY